MHSISDLTTFCRKTTGNVPPKLVGASTTILGTKMYLFGGRLVTERRMVASLYIFDLELFQWEKMEPHPEDDVPSARYFHSADIWNNQLIIFGGMGNKVDSPNPEDLRVLNDIRFFNISTGRWAPPTPTPTPNGQPSDETSDTRVPRPRYAHLSSVSANRLFIIGGQDLSNVWLDDIYVYDLRSNVWVQRRNCSRHCGTYRSIAVSADKCVRLPQEELSASLSPSKLGAPGTRFKSGKTSPGSPVYTTSESLVHLPYTAEPSEEYPSNIYLYSNYNFTDVKRELEVFSPLPDYDFTIQDRSSAMNGPSFPPGLRFPTGAVLGTHLIVAGTYLAHSYQSFSIWALDLLTMTWSRIDPGGAVSTGSWFRGCLWPDSNKFLIFGNRHGNLVDDYNRRLLSWDHVAVVDLEAFGIYQPPTLKLDIPMQELGLAALEEDLLTDFEMVCDDGRKIRCSREVLEDRWPWFKHQRIKFLQKANMSIGTPPTSSTEVPVKDLQGTLSSQDDRIDPRVTPRSFQLSEPYPITLALLQYFYTLALITPLQQAPAVLSQLLVLSNIYQISHLESLVKHAMHLALSNSTSVGVYEVATLCRCRSLQIRALKTVLSYSQKRPSGRSRRNTENDGGGSGGGGAWSRNPAGDHSSATRPRGTSDARLRGPPDFQSTRSGSYQGYDYQGYSAYSPSHLPPLVIPRRRSRRHHEKSSSTVSTSTDSEIRSVAEFFSPVVINRRNYIAEEHEENVSAMDDEYDSVVAPLRQLSIEIPNRITREGRLYMGNGHTSPSLSPSSLQTSDSEVDTWSDDQLDRSGRSSYTAFHMPSRHRGRYSATDGSDTPSLASSTSYSSLASTSWSSRQRYSPPVSPLLIPATIREALVAPHLAMDPRTGDYSLDHRRFESNSSATSMQTVKDRHWGALPGERFPLGRPSSSTIDTITAAHRSGSDPASPNHSPYEARSQFEHSTDRVHPQASPNNYPYSNRPSASVSSIPAPSPTFSRYGGRGLRRVKAPKPPKAPKQKPSIQKMTERLWKDSHSDHISFDKKAQKAEEKKRKKALAREQSERFAADLQLRRGTRSSAQETKSL